MGALTARPPVAIRMLCAVTVFSPPAVRLTFTVCGSTNSPQPSVFWAKQL